MTSSNSSGDNVKGGSATSNKRDPLASLLKTMGGDDCDRPACDDTKSALTAALRRMDRSSSGVVRGGGGGGGGGAVGDSSSGSSAALPDSYRACPPTRDEIGVSTWSLLHSMVRAHSYLLVRFREFLFLLGSSSQRKTIVITRLSNITQAAWYPNKPTKEDKQSMSAFMIALARFYPCSWCASDFQANVKLSPPR